MPRVCCCVSLQRHKFQVYVCVGETAEQMVSTDAAADLRVVRGGATKWVTQPVGDLVRISETRDENGSVIYFMIGCMWHYRLDHVWTLFGY